MREAVNLIWGLSVLAKLAVAIRLVQQGLGTEYRALLVACCILPIRSLLLMYTYFSSAEQDPGRQIAGYLGPVEWVVSAWVVFELFARWTRSYHGIGRFGKLLLASLLVAAVVISMAGWPVEWKALVFAHNFRIFYILTRFVHGTLALFVLGTWLFFRSYPVAIPPNVVRHTYISAVYFVITALSILAFTLNGLKVIGPVNLALVSITAGCFSAWAVLLNKAGQEITPLQQVSPADKERVERLNMELLAFMRAFPTTTARNR